MFQVQPGSLRHRHLLVKVLYPQLLLKQRLHLSQLLKARLQCPRLQFRPNLRNQSALHLHHKLFLNQLQFCQKQQSNHQFQKLQYKNLKVAKLGIHFKRYVFIDIEYVNRHIRQVFVVLFISFFCNSPHENYLETSIC